MKMFKKIVTDSELIIKESGYYDLTYKLDTKITVNENINITLNNHYENNCNIEITIAENANLNYYDVNNSSNYNGKFHLKENAKLSFFGFKNNALEKINHEINLEGKNSEVLYNLSILSNLDVTQNYDIKINHLNKNTISNVYNIGILDNSAKCTLDVTSFIKKGCTKSNAYQRSKIVTLDDNVKAHINPNLLIEEFDVTGGHAASVSKVSDTDIYYLNSRGISKIDAVKIIAIGLLMENVPEEFKEEVEQKIERSFIYE